MPAPLARAALAVLLLGAACGGPSPGAPPVPVPVPVPARRAAEPDARFVRGMIAHHAQALRMVALMPGRAADPAMQLLGERIAVSQQDEIARMRQWLAERGEAAPDLDDPHAHHHDDGAHVMPGMLTEAQFAELAGATGIAFDRFFLERMIAHHEGALVMVRDLFATDGAAQDAALAALARDIDADQAAEIRRMRALLGAPRPSP
jgi:uncharacterized protein (DUF305 family)